MSPKSVFYKSNSIIYFQSDINNKIYILKSGKVSLNYQDIETGQEIHDLIKTGEFFGVKSAAGRYGREETAIVLTDSNVLAFTVPEFEQFVLKNNRIIIKMLKVFSNQLRRIHKQVQNLLYVDEHISPEKGLFSIGEYYLKNKSYSQAIYACKRYLVYYPTGKCSQDALKNIEMATDYLKKYGQGAGPDKGPSPTPEEVAKPQKTKELSQFTQKYYKAVNLLSDEKYKEAFKEFNDIVGQSDDPEYISKSKYEMGRCLLYMKQFDKCITLYTSWIQNYPKHPDLKDALFFIGSAYKQKNEKDKAKGIFRKVLSLTPESETLHTKAKKELKRLEGD